MLEFKDSTNKAKEMHSDNFGYVGDIILHRNGVYGLSASTILYKCTSDELRQIADKLDELNGK